MTWLLHGYSEHHQSGNDDSCIPLKLVNTLHGVVSFPLNVPDHFDLMRHA